LHLHLRPGLRMHRMHRHGLLEPTHSWLAKRCLHHWVEHHGGLRMSLLHSRPLLLELLLLELLLLELLLLELLLLELLLLRRRSAARLGAHVHVGLHYAHPVMLRLHLHLLLDRRLHLHTHAHAVHALHSHPVQALLLHGH
jgi:hypothetical protein